MVVPSSYNKSIKPLYFTRFITGRIAAGQFASIVFLLTGRFLCGVCAWIIRLKFNSRLSDDLRDICGENKLVSNDFVASQNDDEQW